MKASKLIKSLQEQIDKHGDLEVYRTSSFDIDEIEPVGGVYYYKSTIKCFSVDKGEEYFQIEL